MDATGRGTRDRRTLRAAQMAETLGHGALVALIPAITAALLALLARNTAERGAICAFALTAALISVGAAIGPRLARPRLGLDDLERLLTWLGPAIACAIGLVLGAEALLTVSALDDIGRAIAACAVAFGLLETLLLASTLATALLFAGPLALAAVAKFFAIADPAAFALATGLAGFALLIVAAAQLLHRRFNRMAADKTRMEEQDDLIALMLHASEGQTECWIWRTDETGRFHDVDGAMAASLGLSTDTVEGAGVAATLLGRSTNRHLGPAALALLDALARREPFHDILIDVRAADGTVWLRLSGTPIFDRLGIFSGHRGIGANATASRLVDQRVVYLAGHDPLTGLANREAVQNATTAGCAALADDGRTRAFLYIDLDGFKHVNDGFGHAAGDSLLRAIVARWRPAIPKSAVLARFGGDEFAVFYAPAQAAQAITLAETLIGALKAPFDHDGVSITIGASIGIAFAPDDTSDADHLIQKADLALYRAKAEGKGRAVVFTPDIEQSLLARRQLEDDLRLALARGEFSLHYQPLLDVAEGTIGSFEALIRWRSETRGNVAPSDFIPVAERTGLITFIGRWVLATACREAMTWEGRPRIAVNISPQHFRSPDFVADVRLALETSGLPADRLEIEITEGVFLDQSAAAVDNLRALRERGVTIALDDFGTGFSSLNYLIKFPVDKIKIDRSFIADYIDRPENRAIVDAILNLARKLAIRVTAEGVETLEQALALKLRRCDDIQGYLISKPRPADEIPALLALGPAQLRKRLPTLFESRLAALLAMKKTA